jgi:hypothetical protein
MEAQTIIEKMIDQPMGYYSKDVPGKPRLLKGYRGIYVPTILF